MSQRSMIAQGVDKLTLKYTLAKPMTLSYHKDINLFSTLGKRQQQHSSAHNLPVPKLNYLLYQKLANYVQCV